MKYPLNWATGKGLKTQTESSLIDWNQSSRKESDIKLVHITCIVIVVFLVTLLLTHLSWLVSHNITLVDFWFREPLGGEGIVPVPMNIENQTGYCCKPCLSTKISFSCQFSYLLFLAEAAITKIWGMGNWFARI